MVPCPGGGLGLGVRLLRGGCPGGLGLPLGFALLPLLRSLLGFVRLPGGFLGGCISSCGDLCLHIIVREFQRNNISLVTNVPLQDHAS